MQPGQLLDISGYLRSFDNDNTPHWVDGPILVLSTNDYDVTFLSCGVVLYTSREELAVEVELSVS